MSKQFVVASSKPAAPIQLNQADMAALLSLLERVTKEIDGIKKDLATVKSDAHAVNREIVRARHGDKVVNTAGDSAVVMQQLATAPATNATDDLHGYSINGHQLPAELRGYVPGAK